jgi:predicted DsbA family dithiol-disulfide isomerase
MLVEIWSDIACPWCYVGRARFHRALELFEHRDEVELHWRAFELDPATPPAVPFDSATHIAEKYGMTVEQARERQAQMEHLAAADGLELRFDRVRLANTFDAHRMVQLGAVHGVQDAVKGRLMRARFAEGELLSDHETLVRLTAEAGVPEDAAREVLASDLLTDVVREHEEVARQNGIQAVPFFVIDRAMGLSGAHEPELIAKGLRRAHESAAAAG